MSFAHCLHIVLVIGKYTDVFRRNFFLVGRGIGGGVYRGGFFHGGCFLGGRDISMKGAPDFPASFKKRSESKLKNNFFFQLKVRSNIKT
jgi:hypothetical protein